MAFTLPQTIVGATGNTGGVVDASAQYFQYPANLGKAPFDKWMYFEAKSGRHVIRDRVISEQGGVDRTIAGVGLYLSETALKNSLAVAYENNEMGPFMGAAIEFFAQGGQNLMNGLMSPGTGIGQTVAQGIKDVVSLADSARNSVGSLRGAIAADIAKGVNDLTSGGAQQIFGSKPNPRTDVLFSTQQFRTYDLNFLMVPRTEAEAKAIDSIIHLFQFYMLPKYDHPGSQTSVGSFMLGFPYEFEISLRDGNNNRLDHVNKFERCVLESVLVDHAVAGKTAFVKTAAGEFYPVATSLSLSFKEVRLLDRNSDAITRGSGPALLDPRS
jgi:hypothetical protein